MAHGRAAVGVVFRLVQAPMPVRLEITPLCTWRDGHGERFGDGSPDVRGTVDGFVFEGRYRVAGPGWRPGGVWYRRARYRAEAERGLPDVEDLWAAGAFVCELDPGGSADVVAYAGDLAVAPPSAAALVAAARDRARALALRAAAGDDVQARLATAADQFVVHTARGPTVLAGYPWFGEWSRDTMISYEGLLLVTGRADEGRELLLRSAASLSEGMLANTTDPGIAEYNTADATLWFVHAVGRHVAVTGDDELAAAVLPAIADVLRYHVHGTRFGIGVDAADGLLRQGAPAVALTWMDARVDGVPVTQRAGKAVEINALWVNALRTASELARRVGGDDSGWTALTDVATTSFRRRFVRPDGAGLFDVVDGVGGGPSGEDPSVRPNQLLAASLPHGPLPDPVVVQVCRDRLLTTLGLRSLAPGEAGYRGRHRGGPADRDGAYHQGTVWPWLIGPYVDAAARTGVDAGGVLDGLVAHLDEWGLGSVSETTDGDPPHAATGCPFQAWSVAELLRLRARRR
jgi:predicted glycogen debranching enzyme